MPTKPYHAILIKNYSLERQTKLSWRFRLYHHTKSGSTCDPYKLFLGKLVTRHVRACNTCPYHTSRPTKNHYNEKIIPQYKPTPYQGMCLIRKNNMLCRPNGRRSNETDFAQIHFLITFRLWSCWNQNKRRRKQFWRPVAFYIEKCVLIFVECSSTFTMPPYVYTCMVLIDKNR